jgi:hypothetical protein
MQNNPAAKLRGQLITERRKHKRNPAVFERLNILIGQIDNRDNPTIRPFMARTMAELDALRGEH